MIFPHVVNWYQIWIYYMYVYIYEEGGKFEVSPIYRQTPF